MVQLQLPKDRLQPVLNRTFSWCPGPSRVTGSFSVRFSPPRRMQAIRRASLTPRRYNGNMALDTVPSHYDTVATPQQHGDSDTVPARYDTIVRRRLAMTATRRPATTTPMPRHHGMTATRRRATATPTPRCSNTAPARYDTDAWRRFATTATRCPATDAALQQHGDSDTVPASTLHRRAAPSRYDSDTVPSHYDTDACSTGAAALR
ncbi:hypothetical protein EDB84DRAFT_1677364 [Lactarius hengduanensis]|nr:hypothetical protein EDB84DRAFT_1677364 [Lactarius hengduanensis]